MVLVRCLSVCPVCLSGALVCCGQTVGWIEVKLGTQVALGPGHIALDGDPAPQSPKGHNPPIFGPYLLWPNGRLDQDATCYGGRPHLRPGDIVLGGNSAPPRKGHSFQFSAHVYCGQTAVWIKMPFGTGVGLGPGHIVLDSDPAALPP